MSGVLDQQQAARADARAARAAGSFSLTGEVAVVTGASGRLGRIWTRALSAAGAVVVETDTADAKRGDSPFKGCDCFTADVRSVEDVQRLYYEMAGLYGVPTILINNAGVDDRPRAGVLNGPRYEVAREMLDVNVFGTYAMLNVFGAEMAKAGRGTIVNLASLYGLAVPDMRYYGDSGFQKHAMYGATKAAIIQLTKYYAALWGHAGVRVNAIAPGGVVDPGDPLTGQDDGFRQRYAARIPMGRMCTPDDLIGPIVFLASPASSFLTGQVLTLDGGFTCW